MSCRWLVERRMDTSEGGILTEAYIRCDKLFDVLKYAFTLTDQYSIDSFCVSYSNLYFELSFQWHFWNNLRVWKKFFQKICFGMQFVLDQQHLFGCFWARVAEVDFFLLRRWRWRLESLVSHGFLTRQVDRGGSLGGSTPPWRWWCCRWL